MESIKIIKIKDGKKETADDLIAEEIPLTLHLDNEELITLLCTPMDIEDLCFGFLFTSGFIKEASNIKNVVFDSERFAAYVSLQETCNVKDVIFKRLYTSGCGRGALFYNAADIIHRTKISSDFTVPALKISEIMSSFQKMSDLYLKTGGVHSAGLVKEDIVTFREDIGRHNALDKVIGRGLKEEFDFSKSMIITSGRISSEVLFKIQKSRVPFIISRSAPTDQAVKIARDMNITLVGFARGNRMNVYSGEERII